MLNVYDTIRSGLHYNKFKVGELLFVEYTCLIEDATLGIWTPSDYLLHVLTGKKEWRTLEAGIFYLLYYKFVMRFLLGILSVYKKFILFCVTVSPGTRRPWIDWRKVCL